jgi:hypothetical protein
MDSRRAAAERVPHRHFRQLPAAVQITRMMPATPFAKR